jgi:endonuclease/exonuclease/phosphatase family metal-dependent hydrolase
MGTVNYGVITIVAKHLHVVSASYADFGGVGHGTLGHSPMRRGLLQVSTADGVTFGNVHLESPVAGVLLATRRAQLHLAAALLREAAHTHSGGRWFLVGDFNFFQDSEDAGIAEVGATDLWPLLQPDDKGYTWDGENVNTDWNTQKRPDRIIAQTLGQDISGSVVMLGVNDLPGISRPPSDHFGLLASLTTF